jgi:hypothetical protein
VPDQSAAHGLAVRDWAPSAVVESDRQSDPVELAGVALETLAAKIFVAHALTRPETGHSRAA